MQLKATRFDIAGHVATVWLHRPQRHNAWTGRMHAEYLWILAQLEADPIVRVVVVTGTPPAFCVGGDSEALVGHASRGSYDTGLPAEPATPGFGVRLETDHDFAFHYGLRFPVIAAVNGSLDTDDMPILAITGHDDLQAKVHECQGLFGIFKKPWNDRELLRRVQTLAHLQPANPAPAARH